MQTLIMTWAQDLEQSALVNDLSRYPIKSKKLLVASIRVEVYIIHGNI